MGHRKIKLSTLKNIHWIQITILSGIYQNIGRLTFSSHSHFQTFLKSTVLALVTVVLVDGTVTIRPAGVAQVPSHASLEKTFTSFAGKLTVVFPAGFIPTNHTLDVRWALLILLLLLCLRDLTLCRLAWSRCCLTGLRWGGGLRCLVLLLYPDPLGSWCLWRLWGGLGGMLRLIHSEFVIDVNCAPMWRRWGLGDGLVRPQLIPAPRAESYRRRLYRLWVSVLLRLLPWFFPGQVVATPGTNCHRHVAAEYGESATGCCCGVVSYRPRKGRPKVERGQREKRPRWVSRLKHQSASVTSNTCGLRITMTT